MNPRDIVIAQIRHQETGVVPYTILFEDALGARVDEHYGGPAWRARLTPYVVAVTAVDTDPKQILDATYYRDAYGGLWRYDRRPCHLEKPPLAAPSLDGYAFSVPEAFFRLEQKEAARKTCEASEGSFRVGHL